MSSLGRDLRFAARTLTRSPGFTLIAVFCLALGIGINSTIYSAVHAMLVRPLPYENPSEIVFVAEGQDEDMFNEGELSYHDYLDLREQGSSVLSAVGISTSQFVNYEEISGDGQSQGEGIEQARVSASLLPLLGVRPILGRHFRAEEDAPNAPRVAMISETLWRDRYDGDPAVVGRVVRINGEPTEIVGILPARFGWIDEEDLFVPIATDPARERRGSHYFMTIGRLKPGVTIAQANSALQAVSARISEADPDGHAGQRIAVAPLRQRLLPGDVRTVMLVMMGAVGFVLLIACANVANLLLARATARQKEIAIRTALGAGRGRIVRQLVTESVVLSLVAGVVGVLLAVWGVDVVLTQIPEELPNWMWITVDRGVVVFTVIVALVTGVLFGLAPALEASRPNLNETLKDGGRGTSVGGRRGRLRSGLVVAEIALALVLLVGATLMMRSFFNLRTVQPGYDTASQLTTRLYLSNDRFPDNTRRIAFFRAVLDRIRMTPGVEAAAAVNYVPLSDNNTGSTFQIEGKPLPRDQRPQGSWRPISPDYFAALNMPVVRGRPFTEAEAWDSTARVAIVNQAMADRFWPNDDALGKRFSVLGDSVEWLTIVGIVPTVQLASLDRPVENQFYVPYAYWPWRTMSLITRVRGDPARFAPALRTAVADVEPTLPLFEIYTLTEMARLSYWDKRLYGLLFMSFAIIALVLAAIGVYGVMSYTVSQRTHEIGVRVALGAQLRDVLAMVARRGLLLTITGLTIGVVGALALTQMLSGILFNVSATDPMSYIGISVVLLGVALLASYLPARRAAKVHPAMAMRYE